jgi:hypothetical protein
MKKIIEEKDLGKITISSSARSRRYSIRIVGGKVYATMPIGGDMTIMMRLIRENKEKILKMQEKAPKTFVIDESTVLKTASFEMKVFRSERQNFYMNLKDGILSISCPIDTDFDNSNVQETLLGLLEKALRHEAKRLLPSRLSAHAKAHGFNYTELKINNSKGRWGSCSTKKSINISLSVMLLPWHLIDYVLLHELCHTVEMNHGERFWALMNKVTDGKSMALRAEIRKYRTLR